MSVEFDQFSIKKQLLLRRRCAETSGDEITDYFYRDLRASVQHLSSAAPGREELVNGPLAVGRIKVAEPGHAMHSLKFLLTRARHEVN